MTYSFFDKPILNSPYECPSQHWELNSDGQPTNRRIPMRRKSELITPLPKPRSRRASGKQGKLEFGVATSATDDAQEYNPTPIINEIRSCVETWRQLPNPEDWNVTVETARLLQHWRRDNVQGIRPFFCQIEAIETIIWLNEVAPKIRSQGGRFLNHLKNANKEANPELHRIAVKLCTGAGKTTVMAMIIAWQVVNAVRHQSSSKYSRGFLVVTPGITIRDRLQVLIPNSPDCYYKSRNLIPQDMLPDIDKAAVVITNFHALRLRERIEVSKNTRRLVGGRNRKFRSIETEGEMVRRVMPDLVGMKNVVVLNDEAHHCYRERPNPIDSLLKGDEKAEAKKNNDAARVWINGIEVVKRKLKLRAVYDLSATPFFLSGSGYREGTLFPWTVSDFSLMDGIESGIVKLPRVPISDNVPKEDMPKFRNLWDHIGKKLPKTGRRKSSSALDPLSIPLYLESALSALYGHYEKTFNLWKKNGVSEPPVFIIVCNNTATSKLVYDYVSGFFRNQENGSQIFEHGKLRLFSNYDRTGNRKPRPRTLLIDSEQLESGDALDSTFREIASDEIEKFWNDYKRDQSDRIRSISDQEILREVLNTVGKKGRLGESIRCVVSVSMLTEGWDANTVTHVLGVRAFGTQLLCEQVVGRGLRRQSYELNEEGHFTTEYADIFGIPFDFTAEPVAADPIPPRSTTHVHAVHPDRDNLKITFPRVEGYRVELPVDQLTVNFSSDSILELTQDLVGPSITRSRGIIGEEVDFTLEHLNDVRPATVQFRLARHLMYHHYRKPGEEPRLHLFGQLKRICRQWMDDGYLRCTSPDTYPAQLLYMELADMACERIMSAITADLAGDRPVKAILDTYNPVGSTMSVRFNTTKRSLWESDPRKCHVNWVVCDSSWEKEFARIAEAHPRVLSYVKNQSLGFEIPYVVAGTKRKYIPDFIVQVNDEGEDPVNVIVEVKGERKEVDKVKAETARNYWVPGVNNLGGFGRWAFVELRSEQYMERDFGNFVDGFVHKEGSVEN